MDFAELAWGAFLYRLITNYDRPYRKLFAHRDLLQKLRQNPANVLPADFNRSVLTFLRGWGGRHVRDDDALAEIFVQELARLQGRFQRLQAQNLIDVDLQRHGQLTQEIHESLSRICWKDSASRTVTLGQTFGSKLAHVMNPRLFVMWDNSIQESARKQGLRSYPEFLAWMGDEGRSVISGFEKLKIGRDPAAFLSQKFGYSPGKTLAKFLDECNWVKTQRQLKRLTPPGWLLRLATLWYDSGKGS
jgi:hypothetical protein